ncbi:MAG: ribonucleoside-diphosphate reductase subunit alpha [Chlamydiia bacterium]|nr:ribonucleoside-diphosphate reductase subunit alpha [Chlamydiia bacterium]
MKVIQRDGRVTQFMHARLLSAMKSASTFAGIEMNDDHVQEIISGIESKCRNINCAVDVEAIQDLVIHYLMSYEYHKIATVYIEYRANRAQEREKEKNLSLQFFVEINKETCVKKSAWVISKIHSVIPDKNQQDSLAKKVSEKVLSSIKEYFSDSGKCLRISTLSDMMTSAFILEDRKDISSVIMNKDISFWNAEPLLDIEGIVNEMKHKTSALTGKMQFSSGEKEKRILYTDRKQIVKRFESIKQNFDFDIDYIKDRALGMYKPNMNIYSFYEAYTSLLVPYIDKHLDFSYEVADLLSECIYKSVMTDYENKSFPDHNDFINAVHKGISSKRMSKKLLDFDLEELGKFIDHKRDSQFKYLGMKVTMDRYLLRHNGEIIETPQMMFMRIAMGLSYNEENKEEFAKKSYDLISQFFYMPSTPTLFNSGTISSQLSSCYLTSTADSLSGIMQSISDNAMLSKWAGGIGVDWTYVRASGSIVEGTGGKSKGLIPFLKIMNSTCSAVNQGGKRKGTGVAYIEVWHKDIYPFLNLRKNTGDERLRTPDISLATWVPDLFVKRAMKNEGWTLFCPAVAVGLHDVYGEEFESLYTKYEKQFENGEIDGDRINASDLYKKILSSMHETGYPWMVYKDAANISYMQKHIGVIKSSNLCTEIFEHAVPNNPDTPDIEPECAVCTLGSINLYKHIENGSINWDRLQETVEHAVVMLDNAIDNNFYPIKAAYTSTMKHRYVGLGQAGLHDALIAMRIPFGSEQMVRITGDITEFIAYHTILTSTRIAQRKGSYKTFKGSEWSKGKVPLDMFKELAESRGDLFKGNFDSKLDWDFVRQEVKKGMRNALTSAIAPTVTISLIMGITDGITPMFGVMFAKANMSGSFVFISDAAFQLLKERNLWSDRLVEDLKYYEGSIQSLDYIDDDVKTLLECAFEIPVEFLIKGASERQKWIDQGQSLNLFFPHRNGKKILEAYYDVFRYNLKSSYYLRSKSATTIEKATVDVNAKSIRPNWSKLTTSASSVKIEREQDFRGHAICDMKEGCESCQ